MQKLEVPQRPLGQQEKPDAFGLRAMHCMRERIVLLGGRLTVTAAPDLGIKFTAVIPMKPALQSVQPSLDRRSATDRRACAKAA